MWLLDAHNSDHAAGVPEDVFRSIFYLCKQCGRYMTQRVSREHHEDADIGDDTCVNRAKKGKNKSRLRVVAEPFPILQPLFNLGSSPV